jgi:hypothetical protein
MNKKKLTKEDKFYIELYFRCLNPCSGINGREMEWDRIKENRSEYINRKDLEELIEKSMDDEKK